MSGTFNEIDVPPTLVSFAVDVATRQDVITPELKAAGNKLMLFTMAKDAYDLPDYEQAMKLYDTIHALIGKKAIVSAYALDGKGIAAAVSKMGFGNKLGVTIDSSVSKETLFAPAFGSLVAEIRSQYGHFFREKISSSFPINVDEPNLITVPHFGQHNGAFGRKPPSIAMNS